MSTLEQRLFHLPALADRRGHGVVAIPVILRDLQNGLALIPVYRGLHDRRPFRVPEGGKSLLQILLVVATVRFAPEQ